MIFPSIKEKKPQSYPKQRIACNDLIKLSDVSLNFSGNEALKNIDLTVSQAEILFVTGASGAGKTTLLRVLAGDLVATKGKRITSSLEGDDPFISYVDQRIKLIDNLSCEENLIFSYDSDAYSGYKEFHEDMLELARIFGIEDCLSKKMKFANGGLRQKVSVIRALLCKPDVFIADEPTSSLDYDNAKLLFDVLNIYNTKANLTIIWATHNKELVRKFTGKMIHLDKGKLVYTGHACFI